MSDYIIKSTDHNRSIPIKAGTKNGDFVGSVNNDTDLLLYGRGTFDWGSGIEQNLFRLTENWASEAEDDTLPDANQRPKNYTELNRGIKKPLIGQQWFNKSNNRMYFCIGYAEEGQFPGLPKDAPLWKLDGENRYLKLSGGEMNGLLRLTRPSGTPVSLEMRSQDQVSDVSIDMFDQGGLKGQLILDNTAGVDNLRLRKRVGGTIVNEIVMRDGFVEVLGNTPDNGKIRTQQTDGNDHGATLTTKDYVDGQISVNAFNGGIITENLEIARNGTALLRVRADNQSSDSQFILADAGGDKFKIRMEQQGGGIDVLRMEKANGSGGNGIDIHDNYIRTNETNGAIYTSLDPFNIDNTPPGFPGVPRRLVNVATAKEEFARLKTGNVFQEDNTFAKQLTVSGECNFNDDVNVLNGKVYGENATFNIDNTPTGQPSVNRRMVNIATAKSNFARKTTDTTQVFDGSILVEKANAPEVRTKGENARLAMDSLGDTPVNIYMDSDGSLRGHIVVTPNSPSGEDSLSIRKCTGGGTINNQIRLRDEVTEFSKDIDVQGNSLKITENTDTTINNGISFFDDTGVEKSRTVFNNSVMEFHWEPATNLSSISRYQYVSDTGVHFYGQPLKTLNATNTDNHALDSSYNNRVATIRDAYRMAFDGTFVRNDTTRDYIALDNDDDLSVYKSEATATARGTSSFETDTETFDLTAYDPINFVANSSTNARPYYALFKISFSWVLRWDTDPVNFYSVDDVSIEYRNTVSNSSLYSNWVKADVGQIHWTASTINGALQNMYGFFTGSALLTVNANSTLQVRVSKEIGPLADDVNTSLAIRREVKYFEIGARNMVLELK